MSVSVFCAPCEDEESWVRTLVLHVYIVAHSWLHSAASGYGSFKYLA